MSLKEREVEVHVVAPAAEGLSPRETLNGISVERFRYAPRSLETLAYTGAMAEQVSGSWRGKFAMSGFLAAELTASLWATTRFKPHVVHAHWWFPSGLVGMTLSTLTRKPMVTTIHGTDLRIAKKSSAARSMLRGVLRKSAGVSTVSRWLASELSII